MTPTSWETRKTTDSWDDGWYGETYWQDDYEHWPEEWPEDEAWDSPWYDEDYYGEEEYYDAESSREPSEPAATPPTSTSPPQQASAADESFPMHKGKGRSCATCGSRWHSASSCPVNTAKGKSNGKVSPGYPGGKGGFNNKGGYGKGHGKPRFSKGGSSYGKGRGKKGKSKWSPYRGYGKGYGKKGGSGYGGGSYFGFSDKKLNDSFHGPPPRSSPLQRKQVRFEEESHDTVLHLNRPKASLSSDAIAAGTDPTPEDPSTASAVEKRLDFSFALGIFSSLESYHTVKGDKRRGLLVDPGAASGLVGSETLRDLLSVLPPERQQAVSWNHGKQHSVSGISGTPENTMGEVTIPLTLSGAHGDYRADVLGGDGSLCPALLGNPALRRQRAAILTDYFENGDGVLVVQKSDQERHYLRILLTDSGHYLLPVDERCDVTEQDATKVSSQLNLFASAIRERWNDVRHCFLQWTSCSTPERERCELPGELQQGHSDNSPPTFPTTTSSAGTSSCEVPSLDKEKKNTTCTTIEEPKKKTTCATIEEPKKDTTCTTIEEPKKDTTCTTIEEPKMTSSASIATTNGAQVDCPMGRDLTLEFNVSGNSSATFSTTTSGLRQLSYDHCKPFLEDPSERPRRLAVDSWAIEEHYLVRHHRIPRRVLFTPKCAPDLPVDELLLTGERETSIRPLPRRAERRLDDDWIHSKVPNRDLGHLWTGVTKFRLRTPGKVIPQEQLASTAPSGDDAELFPPYTGDNFPEHWPPERIKKAKQYYRAMPEEFYSQSGRRPIAPRNFTAWTQKSRGKSLRLRSRSCVLVAAGYPCCCCLLQALRWRFPWTTGTAGIWHFLGVRP